MPSRQREERLQVVLSAIRSGGKLMFFLSVFLFILEVVSLFGATAKASRMVDYMAILATVGLLALSLVGTRIVAHWFKRATRNQKEYSAL